MAAKRKFNRPKEKGDWKQGITAEEGNKRLSTLAIRAGLEVDPRVDGPYICLGCHPRRTYDTCKMREDCGHLASERAAKKYPMWRPAMDAAMERLK